MKLDMNALLKQAQEMQQQMADAQAAAKDEVAEASAGGGMVVAKANGAGGLVWIALEGAGAPDTLTVEDVRSPAARFLGVEVVAELARRCGAQRGDLLLVAADQDAVTSRVLDALRRELAEDLGLADPSVLAFAFVTWRLAIHFMTRKLVD